MNVFDNIKKDDIHAVCESSRLKATLIGGIYDVKCHKEMDNGTIIAIGSHVEGQLFNSKNYAAGDKAYLVLTAPLAYNGKKWQSAEKYFYNAEGEIARAYELYVDDIFTLSADAFTDAPAVGKFVDASMKVTAEAGNTGFVGEIIEEVVYTNSKSYRVRVIKL